MSQSRCQQAMKASATSMSAIAVAPIAIAIDVDPPDHTCGQHNQRDRESAIDGKVDHFIGVEHHKQQPARSRNDKGSHAKP